jgi:hypothetical protein
MTRIERIAPLLEALSDEEFEQLLSAASYVVGDRTIYHTLPPGEKAEIDSAIARLDRGEGVEIQELNARLRAKLNATA